MNKTILFVDDELNVVQGLKRMLRSMRNEWEMLFAMSGEEALNILSKNHVDVVVTDMRMPQMDGAVLLNKVRELYPHLVRIILSGHSDQELIMKSAKSAHRFMPKPCDNEKLKDTIKSALQLRELLREKNLIKAVTGIVDIPSLPKLYYELIDEINRPNPSLNMLGKIIAQDVSMTARVLQLVNSAFWGLTCRVTSPQQAVNLLGINVLKALVLYVQVFSIYKPEPRTELFLKELWRNSAIVGKLAVEIVKYESTDRKLMDDALVAGMLHDIGNIILLQVPDYYNNVKEFSKEKVYSFLEAEYELLGTTHAELGAYLLGLWGIPDCILESVIFHHQPSKSVGSKFTTLTAVHVANSLVMARDCSPEKDFQFIDFNYLRKLNMEGKLMEWTECCTKVLKEGWVGCFE